MADSRLGDVYKVLDGDVNDPQFTEVGIHFIDLVGGTRGLARRLLHEYRKSKPGSVTRQRILDMVLRCTKRHNDEEGGPLDLDLISSEDLRKRIDSTVAQMSGLQEQVTAARMEMVAEKEKLEALRAEVAREQEKLAEARKRLEERSKRAKRGRLFDDPGSESARVEGDARRGSPPEGGGAAPL